MSTAGGRPSRSLTDIGGRMAVFGRLFSDQVGIRDLGSIETPADVVALVNARVPAEPILSEDAPVFEAAAFLGEWLRLRAGAEWVAEGPFEPHIQVADARHAVVYLLPLVTMMRTASTAGYDGLAALLDRVISDVREPHDAASLDDIPVLPREDRALVVSWIHRHRDVKDTMHASLWRRCSACSTMAEDSLTLTDLGPDWEAEAGTAAAVLAKRPFACACGGAPGEVARFLMIRNVGGSTRLGDIYLGGSHTRVGCWTVSDETVEPYDAVALASDME